MTLRTFTGLAVLFAASAAACSSSSSPAPATDGGTIAAWRSAVGAGGLLARTFDDSAWSAGKLPAPTLYAVTCLGNAKGWVAGEGGYIARTDDGGNTWRAQASSLGADLHAIRFVSATQGVVAGDGGALAVTHDGGDHWGPAAIAVDVSLRAAAASDTGALVVVGDRATVLVSRDAGATWTSRTIAGAADLRGVALDAAATRLVVVDSAGVVFESSDCGGDFGGGKPLPHPGPPPNAVGMSGDGKRAMIGGMGGAVWVSASGADWTRAAAITTADMNAALVDDTPGRMYVGGAGGALFTTADDGAHWSQVPLATKSTIYGLDDL